MKIVYDNQTSGFDRPVAIALGNFDGVHLGHSYLIKKMQAKAHQQELSSAVCIFSPHPQHYYKRFIPLLNTREQKFKLLEETGTDFLFQVAFTEAFAQMQPEAFIENYLIKRLQVKAVIVGDDFRFGYGRRGNTKLLIDYCTGKGLVCESIARIKINNEIVSSSRIREKILEGRLDEVPPLLGRNYSCIGTVVRGDGIGHKLGFPTANLAVESELIPQEGVYLGYLVFRAVRYKAMIYIGKRPTVISSGERRFEVFILDFPDIDIYNESLEVFLSKQIRQSKRFESMEELKSQLTEDKAVTQNYDY